MASSDSEDSDISVHIVESPKYENPVKKRKREKPVNRKTVKNVKLARILRNTSTEPTQEEQDFRKKVQWLDDHGSSDKDEPETSGEESEQSNETDELLKEKGI